MAAIATSALAVFLALVVFLAAQLRDNPGAASAINSQKPRVVVVRRVYETVIRERVIAAPGAIGVTGVTGATVSSSAASVSSSVPAPAPRTRTS